MVEIALAQIDVAAIDTRACAAAIDADGFFAIRQCAIRILLGPPPSEAAAQGGRSVGSTPFGIADDPIAGGDALASLADLSDELALIVIAESVGESRRGHQCGQTGN